VSQYNSVNNWVTFSKEVETHIETYTVPQYGDFPNDLASSYTKESCVAQIAKYASRFGKNARPGQDKLDLLKIAHYAQMAHRLCS
jgi:hypothetical protein